MIKDKHFGMLYRKMIDEAYRVQEDAEEQKALLFQRLDEVASKPIMSKCQFFSQPQQKAG